MNLPVSPFRSLTDMATLNCCWNNMRMSKWPTNDRISFVSELSFQTVLRRTGVLCSQGWNWLCTDLQFISSAGAAVPMGCALSFWVTHMGELRAAAVCAFDQTEMNLMCVYVFVLWKTDQKQSCCMSYCALLKGDCRKSLEPCWQQHTHTLTVTYTKTRSQSHFHALSLTPRFL